MIDRYEEVMAERERERERESERERERGKEFIKIQLC